jgi:hypothetical protein
VIKSLTLKFGRSPGVPAEPIPIAPVTIFVGPNNSGKSSTLREIATQCYGRIDKSNKIVENIFFSGMSPEEIPNFIDRVSKSPNPGENLSPDHIIIQPSEIVPQPSPLGRQQFPRTFIETALQNPMDHLQLFCRIAYGESTVSLDAANRMALEAV